jgi:hypothetical protein
MTAEVAIFNRLGVALAADSAVTIGAEARKIYASSEKLFQLSFSDPVGVMIYGNATFAGYPWELLIKSYRDSLGKRRLASVSQYAASFIGYLSGNRALIGARSYRDASLQFFQSVLNGLQGQVVSALTREARARDGLDEAEVKFIFSREVAAYKTAILRRDLLTPSRPSRSTLAKSYGIQIRALIPHVFGKLPMTRSTRMMIQTIVIESLRRQVFTDGSTGLVIAGFGKNEFVPRLLHYSVEGATFLRVRQQLTTDESATARTPAEVFAFAQSDPVMTFMNGIAPGLHQVIRKSTEALFSGFLQETIRVVSQHDVKASKRVARQLQPARAVLVQGLFAAWELEQRRRYWGPIMDIVQSLPKDELAAMAEALVNLTKFHRRVTPEAETVGGPIDVAVITKGDGFVWLKRKHYFDPTLNPRTIGRLSREVLNG